MRRSGRLLCAAAIALALQAGSAEARDVVVESFDETPIVAHFFPGEGAKKSKRAPTILSGHGWGGSGQDDPGAGSVRPYLEAGYNVLTWDARGFGGSGGTAMIDHPEFEARDVVALVDFVARQPEAKRDGPGDPRVGMAGGSYGGGIQFISAAIDERIDVIAPDIAWNTLNRSLYQRRAIKAGWDLALVGVGIPTSLASGIFSPAGVQTGNQSPLFYEAVVTGTATGSLSPEFIGFLREHGPAQLLERIRIPTLITQGTVDTLFTLEEAARNFRALKRNGIPLAMSWHCGGHGVCFTDAGNPQHLVKRRLAWFGRWLKRDRSVRTGPVFEWIDEEGVWHSAPGFPPRRRGTIDGQGSGVIPLAPGANPVGGVLIFAEPDPTALSIEIEAPPPGSEVLGAPRLEITYTATGTGSTIPGRTYVYGQIVDESRDLVVGNMAAPIPIRLDGEEHTLSLRLETIASLAGGEGYTLELLGQSNLYDAQRATGLVSLSKVQVSLPLLRR